MTLGFLTILAQVNLSLTEFTHISHLETVYAEIFNYAVAGFQVEFKASELIFVIFIAIIAKDHLQLPI